MKPSNLRHADSTGLLRPLAQLPAMASSVPFDRARQCLRDEVFTLSLYPPPTEPGDPTKQDIKPNTAYSRMLEQGIEDALPTSNTMSFASHLSQLLYTKADHEQPHAAVDLVDDLRIPQLEEARRYDSASAGQDKQCSVWD